MKSSRYIQQQEALKWLPDLDNLFAVTPTYSDIGITVARKQDVLVNSR